MRKRERVEPKREEGRFVSSVAAVKGRRTWKAVEAENQGDGTLTVIDDRLFTPVSPVKS